MNLLYGTGNPAKLASMRETLEPLGIVLDGLGDMRAPIPDVEETGATPLENARIKASAYYKAFKRPVFSCDSGLYIEGLPENKQPGVHVRIINGKRLNDEEMIAHYANIAKHLGGKAVARYKNGVCLVISENEIYERFGGDISGRAFCIVPQPHSKRVPGYPIDSLSKLIDNDTYFYDSDGAGEVSSGWHKSWQNGFRDFFANALKLSI